MHGSARLESLSCEITTAAPTDETGASMILNRMNQRSPWSGVLATSSLLLLCTACGGGSGSSDNNVQLESFVLDQIALTAEDTEPVSINALNFVSDEDPAAFDGLFP